MDGFEKLKETLLKSAQGEAEAILASATAAVAVIGKQNADEIWLMKEKAAKEQALLEEANHRRDSAMATLESRRSDLNARQELLDEVMSETLRELRSLSTAKKQAYYVKLIAECAGPESSIVCSAADLPIVEALLKAQGLDRPVESDERMAGGLVFKSERIWEDRSFESTLRTRRDELIEIAAGILFKKESPLDSE